MAVYAGVKGADRAYRWVVREVDLGRWEDRSHDRDGDGAGVKGAQGGGKNEDGADGDDGNTDRATRDGEDRGAPRTAAADTHLDELVEIEDEITTLYAHVHAATEQLLELIAEFDRREGWKMGGFRSCAHWLSFRTGLIRARRGRRSAWPGRSRTSPRRARRCREASSRSPECGR